MFDSLKKEVYEANLEIVKQGLVKYTWGNVSGIDRGRGVVVIKPSGASYAELQASDMVCVDLATGKTIDGATKPSVDTPTHLELYRAFEEIGGVAHSHSTQAVAFSQAGQCIKALGTTHADYFSGDIPCSRALTEMEVLSDYEANTGKVIVETMTTSDYRFVPGVLVKNHGPFTWGGNAFDSAMHAVILEEIAKMAFTTIQLNPNAAIEMHVLEKHYFRKHGDQAYYGQ